MTFLRRCGVGSPDTQPQILRSGDGRPGSSEGEGRARIGTAEAVARLRAAAAARPSPCVDAACSAVEGDAAPRPVDEQATINRDDWRGRLEEQIHHATQPVAATVATADARGGEKQQPRTARRARQLLGVGEVQQPAKVARTAPAAGGGGQQPSIRLLLG
eukprot:8416537-Pyramimonas_sp.AAC.1